MNKKLFSVVSSALLLASFTFATAQDYQPLTVQSGFNADVIANGVGPSASSTNNDVDGVSYAFISKDFQLTASSPVLTYGLPISGIINSAVASTPGLSYQLAPYNTNNVLRLAAANDSGTLTFTTAKKASTLFMIGTGGSGITTVDVIVNFAGGTSQTFSGISIADWYSAPNFAIQGIGRINRTNDNLESGGGTNPRIYQIPLAITTANQSKDIVSVTVTKTGTGGIPNIFAFSADVYNSCEPPTNITSTPLLTSATINWTAPANAPSDGYEIYYSTSSVAPTSTTAPSASVPPGLTSFTLTGLTLGETYYFCVRSNCGATKGAWKCSQFTTGQISATYTANDIATMFDSSATLTTATNCPATLSIVIPTGYKIKSTSVSYNMTAANLGYKSEQKSYIKCLTNSQSEAAISSGVGSSIGTYTYNRTGLAIANNLTGTVDFQMNAFRSYGGTDCNTTYNKVDNNTWKITVTLESTLGTNDIKVEKADLIYPNPFNEVLNIIKSENVKSITITDLSGRIVRTVENPGSLINLQELKSGMYIVSMKMKDTTVKNIKVIKK